MDCSPPGSPAHGILQTRILEWVGHPPPGVLSNPRTEPTSLVSSALAGGFFTTSTTWEVIVLDTETEKDRDRERRGGEKRREGEGRHKGEREEGRREEKGRGRKGQGRERRGREKRREGEGRNNGERRGEVLSASVLATGPQGKLRGEGCVLACHLLRACFSAGFLPLRQHMSPPSIDHIWTSGDYPCLWFFS